MLSHSNFPIDAWLDVFEKDLKPGVGFAFVGSQWEMKRLKCELAKQSSSSVSDTSKASSDRGLRHIPPLVLLCVKLYRGLAVGPDLS